MEGEVLGQANYPYIILIASAVVCMAVIFIGSKL
jgi:hypothetical protein